MIVREATIQAKDIKPGHLYKDCTIIGKIAPTDDVIFDGCKFESEDDKEFVETIEGIDG